MLRGMSRRYSGSCLVKRPFMSAMIILNAVTDLTNEYGCVVDYKWKSEIRIRWLDIYKKYKIDAREREGEGGA